MKKVRITAVRAARYDDLIEKYENPITHECSVSEGDVFISENGTMPTGFCESAWGNLFPFVMTLACGGEDIFDGWMKDKRSAMISCNDGFRPVSFYLEAIDGD
ncbi:MAG: TIGR04076 family protein [Clostridia bacterium]|nr:TIGR04076 family protein [Clostridia bacterium]